MPLVALPQYSSMFDLNGNNHSESRCASSSSFSSMFDQRDTRQISTSTYCLSLLCLLILLSSLHSVIVALPSLQGLRLLAHPEDETV